MPGLPHRTRLVSAYCHSGVPLHCPAARSGSHGAPRQRKSETADTEQTFWRRGRDRGWIDEFIDIWVDFFGRLGSLQRRINLESRRAGKPVAGVVAFPIRLPCVNDSVPVYVLPKIV